MENQTLRDERTILLEARKKLGLTQTQVAEKAYITLRQYQKFEGGERKLSSSSFWMASKILQVLELDVTTFSRGGYASCDTVNEGK